MKAADFDNIVRLSLNLIALFCFGFASGWLAYEGSNKLAILIAISSALVGVKAILQVYRWVRTRDVPLHPSPQSADRT